MPAEGSGRATYRAVITRTGMHGIYDIIPTTVNAAERAVYRVSRNGTPVDCVFIDQNHGSGAWRFLTAVWFEAGDEAAVEVAHRGPAEPGRVLRADAVRFALGADEATATASATKPARFVLGPNYPNPIQHTTQFTYDLPRPADVRIALFDLLGRGVARVIDAHRSAGTHRVRFDVSDLSSGVYFCRMYDDGRLALSDGHQYASNFGALEQTYREYYGYRLANPNHYGIPRIVRLGLNVRV